MDAEKPDETTALPVPTLTQSPAGPLSLQTSCSPFPSSPWLGLYSVEDIKARRFDMDELRRNNREYVQRLQELRRAHLDLCLDLVPHGQEDLEVAAGAYYEWKWLPPHQAERPDHPLWETNVALAQRCAEMDAGMAGDECYQVDLYATSTTGVWGPQDFPEQMRLPDEKERHHYLCAWLVAARGEVSL